MKNLDELIRNIKQFDGVTDDSRKVKKNYIFVAIKGLTVDGHNFINQARTCDASVVVGEKGDVDVKVKDSRNALSILAAAWYGNPSRNLKIIGVTGTDGKTTTATLIYEILKFAGKKVGLISTVSAKIGDKDYDTGFHVTNPEPVALQRFRAEMVKNGCEYAVLEVTSHGLDQERVAGINFEMGVLTNITHEHLDYHKTFENYVRAKQKLFENSRLAIINKKYDFFKNLKTHKVYYEARDGDYHAENVAAATAVAKQLGVDKKVIIQAIVI